MPNNNFSVIFRALRPYQWVKSGFVFLPLIFGGRLFSPPEFLCTLLAAALFALASSAVYVTNDIFDLEEDKAHPDKRGRPLASGAMTARQAWLTSAALGIFAVAGSFVVSPSLGGAILFYIGLNVLYSRFLKRLLIIDVFCVGLFYYLRLLAGAASSGVFLSNWIIMCTVLLALFIGFNKRKYDLEYTPDPAAGGRGYTHYYIDRMTSIIASSLIISYALYTLDQQTIARFHTSALMATVPFVYYGIFRYMLLMDTRSCGGDPVLVLWKDKALQATVILWLIACVLIIYM
jgi:4-hydroxybenzoate polyprenyltransferase